jgi:hypothetical protein
MTETELYNHINVDDPSNYVVTVVYKSVKQLPLTTYIDGLLTLGFDFDWICGAMLSLMHRDMLKLLKINKDGD